MTDSTDTLTLSGAIRRGAIGLGLFAVFTAGLIAATQQWTAERIANNQRAFEAQTLLALVPEEQHDNQLLDTAFSTQLPTLTDTDLLRLPEPADWYQAKLNNEVVAVILPLVAPEGYTEAIRLIMAVDRSGTLLGVRVTAHRETPGLGDQVELSKSDWILNFDGQSLSQPPLENWQVKKDGGAFDQLTGATITPRAVVRAVARGLQFFERNRAVLLSLNPTEAEAS
ncbi:electron transport complex subunit RsxG [Saccharospirillum mangrovi]|uniref:electron transport complex subunit RsxG n=1 Tax=Saccharospirillum mangrovi TaxID=2161747 RepID=UPI000D3B1F3B|nr:electron transport complex subunit RsxG [Saccharospirillum mangrovi]